MARRIGCRIRSDDDGDVPRDGRECLSWPIEDALGLQRGHQFPSFGFKFADVVNGMDGGHLELELATRGVEVHATDDHDLGAFFKVRRWGPTRPHHGVHGSVVVTKRVRRQ